MAALPDGWDSPMRIAKELDVKPQVIYGLIKRDKIKSKDVGGRAYVDREEVKQAIANPGKRGRPPLPDEEKSGMATSPMKKGDIATWGTKTGKRVAQVHKSDEYFTYLKDQEAKELMFRNTSLINLIKNGTITIERPQELLDMLAFTFSARGQETLANALEQLAAEVRSQTRAVVTA